MEDWAEIRRLHRAEGLGIKTIARTLEVSRNTVRAAIVHNDRLIDALGQQAFSALNASPGARAYYDALRRRGTGHRAALRQLANRLVGILHGCLKTGTGTVYDEATAWPGPADLSTTA